MNNNNNLPTELFNPDDEKHGLLRLMLMLYALQSVKGITYGDSWKKRGDLLGVMSNINRKTDRIQNIVESEFKNGQIKEIITGESLTETVADLVVYAWKWLDLFAETRPHEFSVWRGKVISETMDTYGTLIELLTSGEAFSVRIKEVK